MKSKLLLICLFTLILFLFGCISLNPAKDNSNEIALQKCQALCNTQKMKQVDFSSGPCLSNAIIDDWVCDLAHSPRKEIDNQVENQCSNYVEGHSAHFVELDAECNLIKSN